MSTFLQADTQSCTLYSSFFESYQKRIIIVVLQSTLILCNLCSLFQTGIASFTSHLFLLLWQAWRFMLLHTLQTVIKISNYIPSNYARKRLKGQNGKSRGLVRFKGLVHQLHLKQTVNQQSLFTVYNQMNRYLMSCGRAAKKFDDVCRNSRLWTKTFGKVFDQNTMQLLRKRLFRERKREILSKQKWKEFFGNTKNRFSFVKNYLQKRRRIKEKNHLQSCHVSHHTSSSSHVSSHVSSHSSSHVSSHVSSHSSSRVASRSGQHYRTLKQLHNNTKLTLYKKMPWRAISRLWGHINQFELPVWLRSPAIRLYIWMFNCCLEEAAEQDLKQYRNLSEFFRRLLRPGARPLAKSSILTSPADGRVLHCGQVKNGVLEQVKGVTYSIEGFLGPLESIIHQRKQSDNNDKMAASDYHNLLRNNNNQLYYCVIYLAPGDYHRFHSPATWTVKQRRHFPGELFSVNPSVARWLQGLFNFNERALYHGEWCYGFFSMTAVGATNVGSINVYFDEEMQTNCRCKWIPGCYYDKDFTQPSTENSGQISGSINNGHRLSRGQLFGEFNLGSTIVLLFEAPPNFQFTVQPGDRVYYGQSISKNYCRKDNGKYSKRGLVRQRHFRRNSISF